MLQQLYSIQEIGILLLQISGFSLRIAGDMVHHPGRGRIVPGQDKCQDRRETKRNENFERKNPGRRKTGENIWIKK